MTITACFMFVAITTFKTNGIGLSIAMFFGSVKMMLVLFVKHHRWRRVRWLRSACGRDS